MVGVLCAFVCVVYIYVHNTICYHIPNTERERFGMDGLMDERRDGYRVLLLMMYAVACDYRLHRMFVVAANVAHVD